MGHDLNRPSGIAPVLQRVLQRIDADKRLDAYRVWRFWPEVVGEAIAARAEPAGYHGGILSVRVNSHAWMQELQFLKPAIRERLNARLGRDLIRDIYFVSGPTAAAKKPTAAGEPPAAEPVHARDPLPPIQDPRLAAVFERIVRAHARRRA